MKGHRRSLEASIKDGVCNSVMLGAGESYVGAYSLFLNALPTQVGILASLPPLFGALCQGIGLKLMKWGKRRTLLVVLALLQATLWLPMAALAFLPETMVSAPTKVWALIGIVLLYFICSGASGPVWNSLMGDLLPSSSRGQYFGRRSRACEIAVFVSLVIAGKLLDQTKQWSMSGIGFCIVFVCASLARGCSALFLSRHEDPDPPVQAGDTATAVSGPTIFNINMGRFALFVAGMHFAANIAAPFFVIYMLDSLKLSYWQFTLIGASGIMAQSLTLQHWGELSDLYGNKKIFTVSAWGIAISPLLWTLGHELPYLILIQMFTGFVWAGFNLSVGNFLFDAAVPQERARWAAYTAGANGFAIFLGASIGGFLLSLAASGSFAADNVSQFMLLFAVSGLIRLLVVSLLNQRVKEVREVAGISHRRLIFEVTHLRPLASMTFELFTGKERKEEGALRQGDFGHKETR